MSFNDASPFTSHADRVAARMDDLMARVSQRDKAGLEKHLAICDAEPDRAHGTLWRRLAGLLATLAPSAPRRRGTQAVQFFIPDGPYRKQVFALEDRHNGVLVLYLPDVFDAAIEQKLIVGDGENYSVPGSLGQGMALTIIGASSVPGAPEHVEHMLGWNRKAIRIVLRNSHCGAAEIQLVESLCRMAASAWSGTAR